MTHPAFGATAVILAAGASRRFGDAKQVADYRGRPLVAHAVHVAAGAGLDGIVVVTGAHAAAVKAALASTDATVVHNADWADGIASSIRCGVAAVSTEHAIIMLADQPRISSDHIRALVTAQAAGSHTITATRYAGTLGVPAAFHRSTFGELASLTGDRGAAALIRSSSNVGVVDNEAAALDVDTPSQLRAASRELG